MANRIEELRKLAKKDPKTIVLPEGTEERVLEAAARITSLGLARIMLIGKEESIRSAAKKKNIALGDTVIIDPEKHQKKDELIDIYYERRKRKGITRDEAKKTVLGDPVYFGALLVRAGLADGFVAGASYTTSDVARASIYCLEIDRKIGVVSSSFVIELKDCQYGDGGLFVFGDCGIVIDPTPERLAGIAVSSSRIYEKLFKGKACVALLSYSTKGSAKGDSVDKVLRALEILRKGNPDLLVDGELQLDTAVVPEVAKIKAPKSPVAGRANVLIFPNLDAGNIGYKMIQRLGKARVAGPIIQGLTKPASDLSRGCGVEEIIDSVAITVVQAQQC